MLYLCTRNYQLSTINYQLLHWLLKEWKHFSLQFTLNVLINVLYVMSGLLIVWATKLCVDLATGVPHGTWTLPWAGGVLTAVMLLEIGLSYASKWTRAILGVRAKNQLQERLYSRLLSADWQALHRQHSGQLMNRLQDDVDAVSNFLSEQLPGLISALLQFVAAFLFLYWMEPHLALLIVVLSPVFIIGARFYMHKMRAYRHDQRNQESSVHALLQETLQESLVIKTFAREQMAEEVLINSHSSLRDIIRRNTRYSANAGLLMNIAFIGGYLLAFFWGVVQLNAGLITFGAMLAFVQLVGQIQGPIRRLTNYVSTFVNVFTAADRLIELEQLPQNLPESSNSLPCGWRNALNGRFEETAGGVRGVLLNDISFTYDGADAPVLSHWSASFPKGSISAVVGHTGAGKTTLISILLGLLKPQEGTVQTDPSLFSYVPQGNTLFSGTIRRNLLWGNPNATDAEMLEALRMADADFVLQSEKGLDMPCGERGSGLSEGQAQRVAIARALLRPAPILLLDEAFSALDSDTATRILKNIISLKEKSLSSQSLPEYSKSLPCGWRNALNGRFEETVGGVPFSTIICITHRESLIPFADQVLRIPD